jgi:hypothetical protein
MTDVDEGDGYSFVVHEGKLQVNLVKRWLDDAIRLESKQRLKRDVWQHVAFTYDGSRVADGIKLYAGGEPLAIEVLLDDLNQSFESK